MMFLSLEVLMGRSPLEVTVVSLSLLDSIGTFLPFPSLPFPFLSFPFLSCPFLSLLSQVFTQSNITAISTICVPVNASSLFIPQITIQNTLNDGSTSISSLSLSFLSLSSYLCFRYYSGLTCVLFSLNDYLFSNFTLDTIDQGAFKSDSEFSRDSASKVHREL